jgi:FAD:protein FMN transferase
LEANFSLERRESYWLAQYVAMASPCEILLRCETESEARDLASLAFLETRRIEYKFSRYREGNLVHQINNSRGKPVAVDEETARLLHYASECYDLSDGMFDITSGTLRKAWKFDGQEVSPDKEKIKALLNCVGWNKVRFDGDSIALRSGMEIDFGGIGKEYAVDKVADLLWQSQPIPVMVNFGGDLRAVGYRLGEPPWLIGIERPDSEESSVGQIELRDGAVATSGDARRYCLYKGERLGHILNPRNGWPVKNMPRSVTVLADFCMVAGFLATMAMLSGPDAENFLREQDVKHHCVR